MLTLSDDLKQYYNLGDSYIGTNVTYTVTLNPVNGSSELIYNGQLYYMKPSYLYFKDIVLPYVVDNKWFILSQNSEFHEGIYDFTVTITFSTGATYTTDTIRNITVVPTVETTSIPSVLPVFSEGSDFFFSWLCPYQSTGITWSSNLDSMSNQQETVITTYTGHYTYPAKYMINSGLIPDESHSYIKSLWSYNRYDPTQAKRIAIFDGHSRYFLIWITRDNDYMCRPFCKRYDLKESVETSYRYDISDHSIPYQKTSEFEWTLNSDWLTYNEHNVYESLFVSQYAYLYDNETEKLYPVNITNAEWTEKNHQNNNRPFNLTVTAKLTQKSNLIY